MRSLTTGNCGPLDAFCWRRGGGLGLLPLRYMGGLFGSTGVLAPGREGHPRIYGSLHLSSLAVLGTCKCAPFGCVLYAPFAETRPFEEMQQETKC